MRWVETLEDWLTELERRTGPKPKDSDHPAQLPSEGKLMVLAVLLVFGLPILIVGLILLRPYLPSPEFSQYGLMYSLLGIVNGCCGLMMTMPRHEELGIPSPYKYHPWIPLILYGTISIAFTLMAVWSAWNAQVWVIVAVDAIWLMFFTVTFIGKFALDRQRAVDTSDSTSSLESHR